MSLLYTLVRARTKLREMLRELTANQWSDDMLNRAIHEANEEIVAKMGRIRGSGWDQAQEDVTLAANASTFSLTVGTNPTALTKNLAAVICIDHQGVSGFWNPCNELQEAEEFRYRAVNAIVATGDVPPLYRLRRPNIVFLPISTADRTLKITYRPEATTLFDPSASAGSTALDAVLLDVPDKRVPLVVTRAAIMALAMLGEQETQYDGTYLKLEEEMYEELAHSGAEGRSNVVKLVDTPALFSF